jgi:hypothetical protein
MRRRTLALLAAAAVTAAVGVVERIHLRRLRERENALGTQVTMALRQVRFLSAERGRSPQSALAAEGVAAGENDRVETWMAGVDALKTALIALPGQRIPEMAFLDDEDWILAAMRQPAEPTAEDLRASLKELQAKAKGAFVAAAQAALKAYLEKSDGKLPANVADLAPYFTQPADAAVFARYEMVQTGFVDPKATSGSDNQIAAKASAVTDEFDHTLHHFGPVNSGSESDNENLDGEPDVQNMQRLAGAAMNAYMSSHQGQPPRTGEDLLPYLPTNADAVELELTRQALAKNGPLQP